ncbi:YijD family membrane protein [Enterobacter mori]
MKQSGQDKGTLLLALIAGLSINGTFAAIFSSIVPFSIFPLIALVLTVYCLHQRYLNRTMPVGLPGWPLPALFWASCCIAPWCAEYPDIGSNFLPAVLSVALVFWIGSCAAARASYQSNELCVGQVSGATCQKRRMALRLSGLQITVR